MIDGWIDILRGAEGIREPAGVPAGRPARARSIGRVRTLWTTDPGPDPALRLAFPADRPATLATAVVGGVEALVTLVDEHEDFDCHLGDLHNEACPGPGLRVWDRATGALIRSVGDVCDNGTGYPALLATMAVAGRPLAVVGDWARPPKVIDLETGRRVGALPGHDDAAEVHDIATAELPDGPAVVTVGEDGVLRVTVVATGRTMAVDTGERSIAVATLRLAGRPVAATGRAAVTLWDLIDGTRVGVLGPAAGEVPSTIVGWPDGDPTIAVLDTEGRIVVWDVGSGRRRPLGLRPALRACDIAAAAAADGRPLLCVSDGEAVSLWDVHADSPYGAPLVGPIRRARAIADDPGVLLIASPLDDAVSVWHLDAGRASAGSGQDADIRCLTVTPAGSIVAGGGDGVLTRWRLADGVREPDLGSLPARVNAVAVAPGGTHLLAVGGDLHETHDPTLHRWAGGEPLPAVMVDQRGQVDLALTFSIDGEPAVLTSGSDGQTHLTQIRTGLRLGTIAASYPPRGIAVGMLAGRPTAAICGMFGPFTLWDLASRTVIATPARANVRIGEAARGWIVTGGEAAVVTVQESLVRMHNLLTGTVSELQPGDDHPVTALATTDGLAGPPAVAIARTDGIVSVVDATTRREILRHPLPYPATALTWAATDRLVLACRRNLYCLEVPAA
jgi:WD40 repeat protein